MARIAAIALLLVALATASRLPLFDPDEGYYPATAAESVDAGRWWDLTFNGEPRWGKPILSYALIEGAFAVLGRSALTARLPSALEGMALVLLVGGLVSRLVGRRAGALAAIVLSTTVGVQVFARAAHPEIAVVLSMAVTELLVTMWLVMPADERPRLLPVWMGLSIGYGLLAKGPIAVVVPGLGALCAAPFLVSWRARWREAARDGLVASLLGLLVAAPWYAAMTWRHGGTFLHDALWTQNVGRFSGELAHGQSAGVFVLATAVGLFPWIGLLPGALMGMQWRPTNRRDAVRLSVVITAMSSLAFYMVSASKLAGYSLALMPPLAIVVGLYLDDVLRGSVRATASFRATGVALGLIALGLFVIPVWAPSILRLRDVTGGVPAVQGSAAIWRLALPMACVFVVGALLTFTRSNRTRVAALAGVGIAAPLALMLAAVPLLDDAYPWKRFGRQIASVGGPAWIQDYRTPSLTFYAGRPVEHVAGDDALAALLTNTVTGWVVLRAEWETRPVLAERLRTGDAHIVERSARMILVRLDECH